MNQSDGKGLASDYVHHRNSPGFPDSEKQSSIELSWASEDLDSEALNASFLGWAHMFQGRLHCFLTRWQDYSVEKGKSFQQMVVGKLDIHMLTNEVGPVSYMIYSN